MNQTVTAKNKFFTGIVDPLVEAREDFEGLLHAFRTAENIEAEPSGAFYPRRGDDVLADLQADLGVTGPFMLAKFELTNEISYQIVFFNKGFAVWGKNGWIKKDGQILKINTAYAAKDFFRADGARNFKFTPSASVLYAACEKYPLAKITRVSETEWSFAEIQLKQGPWMSENTNKSAFISASGNSGTVTLKSTFKEPSVSLAITPYTLAERESVSAVLWTLDGAVKASLASPGWREINMQSAVDALLVNCPDLTAEGDGFGQLIRAKNNPNNWAGKTLKLTVTVDETLYDPDAGAEQITQRQITVSGAFTSTSSAVPIFTADMAGREIFLKYIDENTRAWSMSEEKSVGVGEILKSGENYYKSLSSGSKTGFTKPIHTEGVVSDGQLMFQYLHSGYGVARILSVQSPTSATALVESYLPDGIVTNRWRLGLLDGITYPSAVGFWKGRMALLYNSAEGPKLLLSQPEDYENFSDYNYGLITSESAINLTINADLSRQSWMLAKDELLIGTQGGVVRVYTPTSAALSAGNISYEQITSEGAADTEPVLLGGYILYLTLDRKNLVLAVYDDNTAAFQTMRISKLNAKDLAAQVADMVWLGYPFNALFMRMKNGGLYRFALDVAEQTRGLFKDTQILPCGDISQGFDAAGEKKEFFSVNGRYLLRRQKNGIYEETPRPWHVYAWPMTREFDADGTNVISFGPLIENAPQRIFVNGEDKGPVTAWTDGGRADLTALGVPQDAELEVRLDMRAKAVCVPFYGPELQTFDAGQITGVSFEVFRTEDFAFGEDETRMQTFRQYARDFGPEEKLSGEARVNWDGAACRRGLNAKDKILTNAPEVRVESVPDKFFCIAGIKILNFGGEGI